MRLDMMLHMLEDSRDVYSGIAIIDTLQKTFISWLHMVHPTLLLISEVQFPKVNDRQI
jgi:hypothetical protein